jgi:hypothetical protein
MNSLTQDTYNLSVSPYMVRDDADEAYKMLVRKLASFENDPRPTVTDAERLGELFSAFVTLKSDGEIESLIPHAND